MILTRRQYVRLGELLSGEKAGRLSGGEKVELRSLVRIGYPDADRLTSEELFDRGTFLIGLSSLIDKIEHPGLTDADVLREIGSGVAAEAGA